MDSVVKAFLESGRTLISDTKMPKKVGVQKESKKKDGKGLPSMSFPDDGDPYKVFVRKAITEKPKKKELLEQMKRFIEVAEESV